jgi:hypothetical protein
MLPLSILLPIVLSVLSVNMIGVSAVVVSPYIAVVPDSISGLTPGTNFTVSIDTDYVGTHYLFDYIWGYQFALSYNPSVIKGVEVVNGDLIVDGSAKFYPGTFDNVAGELSRTVGVFSDGGEVTSGPGTLANVTFTVVGYGASDITIDSQSALVGWDWTKDPYCDYDIINAAEQPGATEPPYGSDHIQHGYFQNSATVTHDVAVTSVTPSPTSVFVSDSVDIMVNVTNQGNINEAFNVTAYTNAMPLEMKTVTNLGSGLTTTLTFTWDTTGAEVGTYTITAVASTVPGETNTSDNTLVSPQTVTLIEPVYLPLAIITAEETEGYVDEDLVFDGRGSYDPDGGAIIAYDWDLGDGTTEATATVVHKYDMEGIYTVTLVVTDSQNQVSYPAYLTVAILEPPTTYDAGLVKWGAKPEAHHWWYSRDDDNMTTITALAGNLGTEPINVSITFAILDGIGGKLAGPIIVENATLDVAAIDPVSVLLDPYDYGYDGTKKVVLYGHVTLKYDSDGDGTPDTATLSVVFRFSVQP